MSKISFDRCDDLWIIPLIGQADMIEMLVVRHVDDLYQVEDAWNCLRKRESFFVPNFLDLAFFLSEGPRDFRAIAIKDGNRIACLACFVYERAQKRFSIGERKIFDFPIRRVSLFGSAVLGDLDFSAFAQLLKVVATEFSFDLVAFGEIPIEFPLFDAINRASDGFIVTSPSRKVSLRWLINLPATFDQYLASLSPKLRKSLRHQVRKLENELKCELLVVHRADQIDSFIRDGEAISRLTYQWNVGQRLNSDDATRRLYNHRAINGQLRCYMVYTSGKPVAFARGELVDGTYNYETPGFDPQYSQFSVGLVLLMWVIRDLIENTNCKVFDFGEGGDEGDYKSRFGNVAVRCVSLELGRWTQPKSLVVIILQEGLNAAKNFLSWIIGKNRFRARLKKAIRKYGARQGRIAKSGQVSDV